MKLSNRYWILRLLREINPDFPPNLNAISLMLTEMKFRGPLFRLCEVVAESIYYFWLRRDYGLTLGMCQVEIKYWRIHQGHNRLIGPWRYFDKVTNYEVCCLFLGLKTTSLIRDTLIAYNGKPSDLYVRTFYQNLEQVRAVVAEQQAFHGVKKSAT